VGTVENERTTTIEYPTTDHNASGIVQRRFFVLGYRGMVRSIVEGIKVSKKAHPKIGRGGGG